nr:hypothetical protein BaRGS_007193 [Batillaria attramentaria]
MMEVPADAGSGKPAKAVSDARRVALLCWVAVKALPSVVKLLADLDYRKAGDVQISSYGKVTIPDYLDIVQDTSDDEREAVTYAVPDFKDAGAAELKWWVILLAVLGGILLLVIIIFVLYKVGFFKRKRPEDMQMYQAEKKQQKMLEDYEEEDT